LAAVEIAIAVVKGYIDSKPGYYPISTDINYLSPEHIATLSPEKVVSYMKDKAIPKLAYLEGVWELIEPSPHNRKWFDKFKAKLRQIENTMSVIQ